MSTSVPSIHVKTGDTANAQTVTLYGHDGDPAVLTGATVVMQVDGADEEVACVIVDAAEGQIAPGRGSLAPATGDSFKDYDVEFEVTYSDETIQTFPENGYERLRVWADLDPS